MIRQPDIKSTAAMLRNAFAEEGVKLAHQKSLNLAARLSGYKNLAHAQAAVTKNASEPAEQHASGKPNVPHHMLEGQRNEGREAALEEALSWVCQNYAASLAGKPVRDADECLSRANALLAPPKRVVEQRDPKSTAQDIPDEFKQNVYVFEARGLVDSRKTLGSVVRRFPQPYFALVERTFKSLGFTAVGNVNLCEGEDQGNENIEVFAVVRVIGWPLLKAAQTMPAELCEALNKVSLAVRCDSREVPLFEVDNWMLSNVESC